jgi:outer membrane protein assembly factor BamB
VARSASLLVAAALLAGCFGGASGGPKPAQLEPLKSDAAPRRLWKASVGGADVFQFSPARVGDALYAASRDGDVTRLDAAKGRKRWQVSVDARLSGGVGADERTVAVGTDRGEVLALDAQDGKLRWRTRVSSEVLAAPRPVAGLVLVRSADSRIHALGAEDGKRRWSYQRTPAPLTLRTPQGLVAQGGLAFAGFSGGKLVALALENGAVRWEATVALPKGATELERVTYVIGDPAVIGREVCAAAFQGRVACFDAQSGTQLWAREMSSVTGVSVDARYAYVSDEHGAVHALDRSNGRSLWKQDRLAYRQLSLPLPVGGTVVVGDFEGYLHFLARDSGAFVARAETDGSAVRAAPLGIDGGFVVQTQDGGLFALAP